MTVHVRHERVVLTLPVMPPKLRRGDRRNYRRWHAWVEAVRALAQHYRDVGDGRRRAR